MPESNPSLAAALKYISMGWRVFPVNREKKPVFDGGFYQATRDPAKAVEWWGANPTWGVAAPTGFVNDFWVLDIDPRNGGDTSLLSLIEEHGPLPDTSESRTGGGGVQYFFKHPGTKVRAQTPWPGIDIKGDGGYVILAPSIHPSGQRYVWAPGKSPLTTVVKEAPRWLLELLKESPDSGPVGERELPGLSDGPITELRNVTLTSIAGAARRWNASYDGLLALLKAENAARCQPPLPEDEVERIARSVSRYAPQAKPETPGTPWRRADLAPTDDPEAGKIPELVESVVIEGGVTLIAAAWKSGKTLLSYRLLLDAVLGSPAWGHFPVVRPLRVALFQWEMPAAEDYRRLRNLRLGMGIPDGVLPQWGEEGRFALFNRPPGSLTQPRDVSIFHKIVLDGDYDLILIDSITAAFAGGDLHDNSKVRLYYNNAFMPLTSAGKGIILLHHHRKTIEGQTEKDSIMGAQTWGAAADRIFTLNREAALPGDDPRSFRVILKALGSWAPTDIDKVTFNIHDEGDDPNVGTCIEPVADGTSWGVGATEKAARTLWRALQERGPILQSDAVTALREELGIGRNVMRSAISLATARGWIKAETLAKRGSPVVLAPGSAPRGD